MYGFCLLGIYNLIDIQKLSRVKCQLFIFFEALFALLQLGVKQNGLFYYWGDE